MFIRSGNNTYQIIEQLPDFGRMSCFFLIIYIFIVLGWRYNKTYFLATKTGASKDERYLLSWVFI